MSTDSAPTVARVSKAHDAVTPAGARTPHVDRASTRSVVPDAVALHLASDARQAEWLGRSLQPHAPTRTAAALWLGHLQRTHGNAYAQRVIARAQLANTTAQRQAQPASTPAASPAAATPVAAAAPPVPIGASSEEGFFSAIAKLKSMLGGVMAAGGDVIAKIVSDPVAFLGNMLAAIRQGLGQFVGNIGTHLKNGLIGWLLGSLGEAGLQMPQSFDAKGILGLVLQVVGLTYGHLRTRAVSVLGERAVGAAERTVDIFKTLATEGVTGIWHFVSDHLSGLKEMVLGQIQEFVAMRVVRAGITWLLSMLNPASALVRACMMIYDVVMFFKERGSQIIGVVNAVIGSIGPIAAGAIGGAANMVEQALARVLPVAISFLASLLGLGGIADKIKSIIAAVQAPVNKAIDAVVGGAVKLFKRLGGDKLIKAAQKGVSWGKEKIEKGKAWVKGKAESARDTFYGGTVEERQKRLRDGVMAGKSAVERFSGQRVGKHVLGPLLSGIRLSHRLPLLEPIRQGGFWAVHGDISRMTVPTTAKSDEAEHGSTDEPTREKAAQVIAEKAAGGVAMGKVGELIEAANKELGRTGTRRIVRPTPRASRPDAIEVGFRKDKKYFPLGELRAPLKKAAGDRSKGHAVESVATIKLAANSPFEALDVLRGYSAKSKDARSALLPAGGKDPSMEHGGFAQLNPQVGSIDVLTWNTSPGSKSLGSHAETQFVNFVEAGPMSEAWGHIQSITIRNFDRSACSGCAGALAGMLEKICQAQRRLGKVVLESADIHWTRLHEGVADATTSKHIEEMAKAGWTIHMPESAYPKGPGAETGIDEGARRRPLHYDVIVVGKTKPCRNTD